ncbi:Transmembrane emp24 domain-containing protein 9 [Phytophthora pseudosyringae]|uniref:Transmembrane emp24 domain-containing protein 9 n=1 Tax=Phytophthora pseudosyringae TaxID=221518 RepID=A0A8T1V9B3_9STRA|nr:Transmembrane emp24 domain-containing protein 9 [Phytophthora pseudosyringae]
MRTCALLLLSVLGAADALYFNVQKEGHRCFLVDVPKLTTFRAEYESPDTTDVMGAISFTAQVNGPHWVCVGLDSSNYALPDDASMRFALRLTMGTSHEEYQNLARKNQMDDLHLEIMKLRDRVSAIQRNQDYAKEKNFALQSSIESNNQRATWVSVLQIALLLITGFYQGKHLQAYFHKKKLV